MQTAHDLRAFVNVISEGAIGRCCMNQVLLKNFQFTGKYIYFICLVFISLKNVTELHVILLGNVCSRRATDDLLVAQNIFFKCIIFSALCNHVQQQLLTHTSKKFINFIGNTCSGKLFLRPNFPTLLKRDCSTGVSRRIFNTWFGRLFLHVWLIYARIMQC